MATGHRHTFGVKSDGTVLAVGWNEYGQCDVSSWRGIQLPYLLKL
ncbi:RCC1 domain-containing protein [Rossellomorea yichunensis]|nr:RCC1 domain-containing protein [Rossellomorea sp. YC4-1]MDT9027490.1 RCC1 domain-containing protein [Rossellomorea sp. YC4-1]